jgi:hypothetical protein
MNAPDRFARNFIKLIQFAMMEHIDIICTSMWRDQATQLRMFHDKLSNADGVNEKSMHQLGRAADIAVMNPNNVVVWEDDPRYHKLGQFWESLGGVWGHRWYERKVTKFDDLYHFEM